MTVVFVTDVGRIIGALDRRIKTPLSQKVSGQMFSVRLEALTSCKCRSMYATLLMMQLHEPHNYLLQLWQCPGAVATFHARRS
jgi:hypothetical protein